MAEGIRGTVFGAITSGPAVPQSGVSVTVYKAGTTNLASLYSDDALTASVSNPLTSEADGSYFAFAPNGKYDIVFSKAGVTFDSTDSVGEVLWDEQIVKTITATSYSLSDNDYIILADASGAAITINLMALSGVQAGRPWIIIKIDATANSVTIDPSGAETINGAATLVLTAAKQGTTIRKGSTEWQTDLPPAQTTSGTGKIPLGRSSDGKLESSWGGAATSLATLGSDAKLTDSELDLTTKGDLLTRNSTSLDRLPVGANQTLLMADSAQTLGIKWISGGIFIGHQVLTSGTSYTPTSGTKHIIVEMVGGGGAGGGGKTTTAAQVSPASGGGGGGYARKVFLNIGAGPFTYAIGAGGTGVSGADGNVGGNTSFTGPGPLTITGTGGGGGVSGTASGVPARVSGGSSAGGTNGDININSEAGTDSFATTLDLIVGGEGGSSMLGHGAHRALVATVINPTPVVGTNYGGGGGGTASILSTSGANTGGAGAQGVIIVWEFA